MKRFLKNLKIYFNLWMLKKRNKLICNSLISIKATYGQNIRIGRNVIVSDDTSIGDYTYINKNTTIENCQIGKYCSISEGVKINPVNHNFKLKTTHPIIGDNGHYGLENKKVVIGNDVWISLNVIILQGVTIGNGAVIGAGAVVTHDIPPYSIAVGVPAKVIKYRFDRQTINELEQIKWWDWPEDKIMKNIDYFRCRTDQII
ncbi:CatB-related O-acetyltransferase [Massilimicrobiota sp. An142]|uniref:CatB-related O-acetyltransferase n=1 Tax=Massilimicrobiota sp. An142 TaxID=1965564 RepID=UPI0013024D04|nr:CatB-related O-acetyltransferase [Massilimicrobiota sp. An142]